LPKESTLFAITLYEEAEHCDHSCWRRWAKRTLLCKIISIVVIVSQKYFLFYKDYAMQEPLDDIIPSPRIKSTMHGSPHPRSCSYYNKDKPPRVLHTVCTTTMWRVTNILSLSIKKA
jgi:hypothetical protein